LNGLINADRSETEVETSESEAEEPIKVETSEKASQCELAIVKHFKLSTPSDFSNKENEKSKKKTKS
jgi:hypothetical protein